jgi:hypothetical protein
MRAACHRSADDVVGIIAARDTLHSRPDAAQNRNPVVGAACGGARGRAPRGLAIPHLGGCMKYICDAPGGKTWFRIETEAEAAGESDAMRHAVEKFFRKEHEKAAQSFHPISKVYFEQEIGLKAHIQREMPLFLTLRDDEGNPLVTAMLPPGGRDDRNFRPIIVGVANSDPYVEHADAIRALAQQFGLTLERSRCYPYRRD